MGFQGHLILAVVLACFYPVLGQNVTLPQYLRCQNDSIASTLNPKCHLFVYQQLSFNDAEAYCNRYNGGHLARVNSAAINLMISVQSRYHFDGNDTDLWLGGRARNVSGARAYVWTRLNSLVKFTNFAVNTSIVPNYCISLNTQNQLWFAYPCGDPKSFVCELPIYVDRCTAGWSYFGDTDSCYKASSAPSLYTFNQAETNCTVQGGHLVSIHNESENTFVTNLASTLYLNDMRQASHIGFRTDVNGQFSWTDGSVVNFQQYFNSSAVVVNKRFVLLPDGDQNGNNKGKWIPEFDGTLHGRFICRKPAQRLPRFYEQ